MRHIYRKLSILRDIILIVFFVAIGGSVYGQINKELVFAMLFGISIVVLLLTGIDIILISAKVKRKIYFYLNAILQLPATFIVAGLGGAGLLGIAGAALFILNVAIIIGLKKASKAKNRKSKSKK